MEKPVSAKISGFLHFSCENLRFAVVTCEYLQFPESVEHQQKSAKSMTLCENCPISLSVSPTWRALILFRVEQARASLMRKASNCKKSSLRALL